MIRRTSTPWAHANLAPDCFSLPFSRANADDRGFNRVWGGSNQQRDWERFYHYPYVFYPHNYYGNEYYRSSDSLYHRYPTEMRVPVYNKKWHNEYPQGRRYHQGTPVCVGCVLRDPRVLTHHSARRASEGKCGQRLNSVSIPRPFGRS